jgi:hypothetical protein
MSTHTLRISFFHKSPFKIAKRKIQLSPISKVSGLCSVLITGWVHLGIKGWALFPELRVQGWKFLWSQGGPTLLYSYYFRKFCVWMSIEMVVFRGEAESLWQLVAMTAFWKCYLVLWDGDQISVPIAFFIHTSLLFISFVLLWMISQWFSFYLFKTFDIYFIM